MHLAEFQRRFSKLLRDINIQEEDMKFWNESTRALGNLSTMQGIQIYRHNGYVGQLKTLTDSFPRTFTHVGAEEFRAMVERFFAKQPSQSEDLLCLSEHFYSYIYESDVSSTVKTCVATDHAWEKAFYASQDEAMEWSDFNKLSARSLDQITLELRNSATIVQEATNNTSTTFSGYLVWRDDSFTRRIDRIEEKLLPIMKNIHSGKSLSHIAQATSGKEVSECLAVLIERKWLKKF